MVLQVVYAQLVVIVRRERQLLNLVRKVNLTISKDQGLTRNVILAHLVSIALVPIHPHQTVTVTKVTGVRKELTQPKVRALLLQLEIKHRLDTMLQLDQLRRFLALQGHTQLHQVLVLVRCAQRVNIAQNREGLQMELTVLEVSTVILVQ